MQPDQSPNKFLLNSICNLPYADRAFLFLSAINSLFSGGPQHPVFLQTSQIRHCLTALQNREALFTNAALLRKKHKSLTFYPPLKLHRKFFKSVIKDPWKNDKYILVPCLFLCLQHRCLFSPPSHVGGQSPGWGWLQAEAKWADPKSHRLPEGTWLPDLPFQEGKQTSSSSRVATQRAQFQTCLKSLLLSQPPRAWSQCMACP